MKLNRKRDPREVSNDSSSSDDDDNPHVVTNG